MAVNETVVDAVGINNVKTIGEQASFATGLAMQNQVAHQNRMSIIAEAAVGNVVKNLTEMDPGQAISALKALSGNDLAGTITALLASLASGQQQAKTAQSTPPQTGQAPGGGIPPAV